MRSSPPIDASLTARKGQDRAQSHANFERKSGGQSILLEGLGFRVQGSGFRVQGSGFRVQGSGFRVQGSGFRVLNSGIRVQGSTSGGRAGGILVNSNHVTLP